MPKHASSSSIENKVRLSLLQAEKRFVDLELGLTEVKDALAEVGEATEKLKNIDPNAMQQLSELPDLKQRLEDVEDLLMVESAGIEELKNLMEDLRNRLGGEAAPKAPADLNEKIAVLEGSLGKIANLDDLKTHVDSLEHELAELRDQLASRTPATFQAPDIRAFAAKFEQLKAEVETKIEEFEKISSSLQVGESSAVSENFRKKIDNLSKRLSETASRLDSFEEVSKNLSENLENIVRKEVNNKAIGLSRKLSEINSRIESVENFSKSLPEDSQRLVKKELDTINRKFSVIDSRTDAAENVSKNILEEVSGIKSSMKKFESFENASTLVKELQNKMDEFKFIESEIKRVSNRVEGFYTNIDQKLDKMRELEKVFPQMKQDLDQLRDEISKKLDENKILILDRATKEETSEIRDRLGQAESKISDSQLKEIQQNIEKLREEIRDGISEAKEPLSVINIEMSDFMSRIVAIETRLGNIEKIMQAVGKVQPIILE